MFDPQYQYRASSQHNKAEKAYDRILGYSNSSEDVNSNYWQTQLASYQKSIDLTKAEVHNTILKLSEKGVNVTEIEKQSQATAQYISKIDEKLDALPLTEIALIKQYEEEKKMRMKLNEDVDYVKERKIENEILFQTSVSVDNKNFRKQIDNDREKNDYLNTEHDFRTAARR